MSFRDYHFKVLIIGDSRVGKSTLLARFAYDSFIENPKPTIGVDLTIKRLVIEGKEVKLQFCDTSGAPKY